MPYDTKMDRDGVQPSRYNLYLDDLFAECWDWLVVGKIEELEVRGPKAFNDSVLFKY